MRRFDVLATVVIGLVSQYAFAQGGLTPPGAPGATMKTLEQVEARTPISTIPYTISSSGSYYLTTNLSLGLSYSNGVNGVLVSANDVTIDLNGFALVGTTLSGGSGVHQQPGYKNIRVFNGTVSGWASSGRGGIHCLGTNAVVSSVQASGNWNGIYVGAGAIVEGCTASDNLYNGILCGNGAVVKGCVAFGNGAYAGIYCGDGAVISDCSAYRNTGFYGIYSGFGATIRSCVASENVGSSDTSYGIFAEDSSSILNCTATYNSHETPDSAGKGIGIYLGFSGAVKGCTASYNSGDGIRVGGFSRVEGNTCDYNGRDDADLSAGIRIEDSFNRIEGNTLTDNHLGLDVLGADNFIICNSAGVNDTNYVISAGNNAGTITNSVVGASAWSNMEI